MGERQGGHFSSPFEVAPPAGAEGWEEMYPYYALFSEERRGFEEGKFWFRDSMHHPDPLYPFDAITAESWWVALGEYNSRVFALPTTLGIDQRILNGYVYVSPNAIVDEAVMRERVALFADRAGYYYEHWDELYRRWIDKAEAAISALRQVEVPGLPEIEDVSVVREGRGVTSAFHLIEAYDRLIESMYLIWHYHFEMLNLGYAAYQTFFAFCKKVFPEIPEQNVAKMVSGIDVVLFRPDEELKRLARAAIDFGVGRQLAAPHTHQRIMVELRGSEAGRSWLEELEKSSDPWFSMSSGTGFYHVDRSWADDLAVPFAAIRDYIVRLERGEDIGRPLAAIRAERERVTAAYRDLLPTAQDRQVFDERLQLARKVFPYIENHNFYVEHWHHTVFWNKVRDFGRLFARSGFVGEPEDIFYLNRWEVGQAIYDMITAWAAGTPSRGSRYWMPRIARRKIILDALKRWSPPAAVGVVPSVITDPIIIMLWGITTDAVRAWAETPGEQAVGTELRGSPGSPGIAEGMVRVLASVDDLKDLRGGEILVCPITAPSWTPAFVNIKAVVTDIGGIMSHAAIVCREYGLPAVVGTGSGTQFLKTGQRVIVDGAKGIVTVQEDGE